MTLIFLAWMSWFLYVLEEGQNVDFQMLQLDFIIIIVFSTTFLICKCKNLIVVFQRQVQSHWNCLFESYSSSSNYNKEKILKMTTLYPDDYDDLAFVMNFSIDEQFSNLSSLSELSNTLVSSKLHQTYPTFYKLLKLGLMLLVFTTTVERVFSVMKIN